MTISKTEIFNIALSNLGVSSLIQNPNQNDTRAILLNNYYEIARDTIFEIHDWNFASAYKSLALSSLNSPNPNYEFAFVYPTDCISPRCLIDSVSHKEKKFDIAIINSNEKIILSNSNPVILRYTKRIENETLYPAPFVCALGFYLAYLSAQTIVGSNNKKNICLQDYQLAIKKAILSDARKIKNFNQDDNLYTDMR